MVIDVELQQIWKDVTDKENMFIKIDDDLVGEMSRMSRSRRILIATNHRYGWTRMLSPNLSTHSSSARRPSRS